MNGNPKANITETYAEQLHRCVQALALAKNEAIVADVTGESAGRMLDVFTEGNFDKRRLKIEGRLTELKEVFEDFEQLISEYIGSVPLSAYDTGSSDSDNFMNWLTGTQRPTAEQFDHIICQQARIDVEELGQRYRVPHARFQELWTLADRFSREWETNPALWLHLNPIHVFATFRTPVLLDEQTDSPATVLFFAVGSDIRTAVLEPEAEAIVRDLETMAPIRLTNLLEASPSCSRQELVEICRDLAEMGLAAFG